MDWHSEIGAAWAQAILSALAILVSTLLAILIPARERKLARLRQERDAGRRLLWAVTAAISQYAILKPELEQGLLSRHDIDLQARRMATVADDMRAVQIVDVPAEMTELLWRTQLIVQYFAGVWDALQDPAFDRNGETADAETFNDMARKTGREIAAVRIGGQTLGNPKAEWFT